ncbi:uncharacterized protein LOC119375889 [Rhipicephalus sanguineus]|uniref:uncharacterized protein LOC119375889 n=1 Tax=Rhipicephalus sanguineus TaxID=34632 RepID=UPI00189418C8|nr:uncharacterized protein LOC119375889 [Rhipicephalus sanguineus]
MAEESPPSSATPVERARRSLVRTSSHRRSESVACTRMLWNLIANANTVRLRHEQAQRLCKVVGKQPTALHLPAPAAAADAIARGLATSGASCPTVRTALSSDTSAALQTALPGVPNTVGRPMTSSALVSDSRNVPLPVDTEPELDDMDTTSTRKRSRPSESGSDDEGASRKMQAVATERVTVMSPTAPPSDTVAEEQPDTPDADGTNENEFQTVFSKSQKRRQRASTAPRPVGNIGSPTAPAATPAAHPSTARVVPEPAKPPTATQAASTGVLAAADTMLRSALSPLDSGTVLFRPANAGASFHRTSRLAIAQALSALPGVKEVRVNTKKNIVAADASTAELMDRLLATSELAGIPVTARPPADRSQSSGVVQGVDGDYTDEALLAAVTSEVPVIAARRQGTSLILRFASPVPPARVHLFRMAFEVRPSRPRPLQCLRCGRYGHITAACRRLERCLRCGNHHGKDASCTSKVKCLHCGRPHSADSTECQLWQRERRLATIKASSPTYLPHREAQAALRSSSSGTSGPQLNQTTGKSYAAAVGAPSKDPRPTGAQQREPPAGPKKQGSAKPRPPTKATSQPHADQENANLRLLLRAVADLLPPENQLRSICLQEVYVATADLRLPGYIGYHSATSCILDSCQAAPCMVSAHPQGRPRCAVYVRRELPQANINVADVTGGALECCAVTVRLRGVDTTVASVYVRPGQRWNAADLLQLTARLGHNYLLCGDMNAHHTMWGSRTCSSRGRDLVDVIHQLGLQVLNTGSFTFVRKTGRPSCTAIDVSLASEGDRSHWATQPDCWGSDHLPIVITPAGGKIPRTRQCRTVDWRAFRQQLKEAPKTQDFLDLVAAAAQAATIQSWVPENHPVPDLRHLNLRAARRRAERKYLKAQRPDHRTLFNRVDAVCRRHANRRRRQSWQGICHSLSQARGGAKAWRLLRSLVIGPMARQPVLAVAIRLGISEQELAERLADRFAALPLARPAAITTTPTPKPPQGHHPAWTASQIAALCQEPIFEHELNAALARTKRRSAPGADGITYEMLRNLDVAARQRLLRAFNDAWQSGTLPEAWLTAMVVPVRKHGRSGAAIASYRPVSLTSAACKLMEAIALQTGFRRHRCTADSIADVVSTLEEARSKGEVALLVLLDVQSAFDGLPHMVIESALDALGITGFLRAFIRAFLAGRTLRVRVGRAVSDPRPVTAGVPQGSVLSPFLFNLVLAGLPGMLPVDKRYPTQCSLYADDVALWVRGPRRNLTAIRRSLQRSLDAVTSFFRTIGLIVSPTKTEALLVHPRVAARRAIRRLVLGDRPIPWSKAVTYLGLKIDHRLTWIPAVKLATFKATRVQTAVGKLLSRGQGCTPRLALQLYQGAATAVQTYALPLVQLAQHRKEQLERQHRMAIRRFMGLPRQSPVAASLAEAQTWPLSLLMLRQALNHVDRLHRAPGGDALLRRLRSRPASRMGQICTLYEELVPAAPCPIQPPPPHQQPLDLPFEFQDFCQPMAVQKDESSTRNSSAADETRENQ